MARNWEERGRGRSDYGSERGSESRGGTRDRDWSDRAGDEVRSWFGDEDAERRRRVQDGRRYESDDRGYRDESGRGEYADRDSRASYGGYDQSQAYGGYGGSRREYVRDESQGSYPSSRTSGMGYGQGGWGSERSRDSYRGSRGYAERDDRGFMERAGDEVASWFGDEDAERRRQMDARHRGRGPKNYKRSDDRIREDVSDRLSDDPHIDASEIEVSVDDGEVTLTGSVDERFAKRHAEDVAERVSGVKHVQNNLRISQQQGRTDTSGALGGNTATETSKTVGPIGGAARS